MRRRTPDMLIITLLFVLPLVMFWQQTVGGRTLIPTENLYQFEPFATYREVVKAPAVPQNGLVLDLLVENYQWKTFIRQSIAQGEIPLWNPYQFSGIPFLAAGQHSALYPFSVLYYIMPLTAAYGWFTVVQLWLAGVFMFLFMRGLSYTGRFGATISGVVYQLSAFFVISAVFPMIIAAAVWLPLILLMVENVIGQKLAFRGRPSSVPWVIIGAIALGCNILAGHVEITYYTLIIAAYYAAARLIWQWWKGRKSKHLSENERPHAPQYRDLRWLTTRAIWLIGMVALGLGLGAIQFIPLFEAASTNFREGSASLDQVLKWAHPLRDVVQFAMPNFYGNPSHHSYYDLFSGQTVPATVNASGGAINTIDWGIKNYVEGALYLGILPLVLAAYALLDFWFGRRDTVPRSFHRIIFAVLALVSLTFMFGMPTYAALYILPGIGQLHSPFRWIFAVTLSVAVLAGFGADALKGLNPVGEGLRPSPTKIANWLGRILIGLGGTILLALVLSRLFYPQIEPLIDRIFQGMALAPNAFADAKMFYSYEFTNILTFGVMTLASGVMFWWAVRSPKMDHRQPLTIRTIPLWQIFAVGLVAVDLMIASWGFNPASDPALLDFVPPAVQWLKQQPGDWRYTTLEAPNEPAIMNANIGWSYGLHDIRGYESIIPKQYTDFMEDVAPQRQLEFNRVAPLYPDQLPNIDWTRLALLNVRYIIARKTVSLEHVPITVRISGSAIKATETFDGAKLAYTDKAVNIWELPAWSPRAFIPFSLDDVNDDKLPISLEDATITSDTGREKLIDANLTEPRWLVVSETYMPGWRAFIRPQGGTEQDEQPLDVQKVQGNFQGVRLTEPGNWTIRLTYSPPSFQLGLFGSFIAGILLVFIAGVYLWRLFIAADEQESGVKIVARNSLAPIILNLFNRGIDFGFAFIMLRILGPDGSGIYTYAAFIFGWFDIFTNFGLNVFLTREVARDQSKAWPYFFNTSLLRLALMGVGVVLLVLFLLVRQSTTGVEPLTHEAVVAIILLYIGLLPNSLSTGMSALFYAFQKAEYPAAIATIATINKAVFGVTVLALGFGVIGLAGVSIITNCLTLAVMVYVGRGLLKPSVASHAEEPTDAALERSYKPERKLIRGMVSEGFPLMLNHFLASIFFQIDVVIIQSFHGDTMVGQYGVAYKWVAALNVIPAFFTMALLPVMSKQAHEDRPALKRNYGLAIKLLVSTALPLAVIFTFMAYTLTGVLGGSEFLPDGAIATQLMIWSIPIGWINSLTQYVLIALDLQRRITRAFMLAVGFNILINLVFIPQYGYRAAAITTIFSELTLLIPFAVFLHGAVGRIAWFSLLWKPVAATAAMIVVLLIGWSIQPFVALVISVLVYGGILLVLRPLDSDELQRLMPLVPGRIRRLIPAIGFTR